MREVTKVLLMALAIVTAATPLSAQCAGFFEQPGDREAGLNCANRPPGSVCVAFADGYVWLIYDAIAGWKSVACGDVFVGVAIGFKGDYHHVYGTDRVRFVPHDPGATVGGVSPTMVLCRNETTGQTVSVSSNDVSWDCRSLGLVVLPGDLLSIGVAGVAQP